MVELTKMQMESLFTRINLEREDVRQDLDGMKFDLPEYQVGDFGCGAGFTTLCLALEIANSSCIGIDQFIKSELSCSIDDVQSGHGAIQDFVRSCDDYDEKFSGLVKDIYQIDQKNLYPKFIQGDVVLNTNLPTNLDIAYCKKLLWNIKDSSYGNPADGEKGLLLAVKHIIQTIKPGGRLCSVEPVDPEHKIDFVSLLETVGFKISSRDSIKRGEIGENSRNKVSPQDYVRIICNKPLSWC